MLTPQEISKVIKEEENNNEGSILVAHRAAKILQLYANDLVKSLANNNIRTAMSHMAEVNGALEKVSEHVNALADAKGLIGLKTP